MVNATSMIDPVTENLKTFAEENHCVLLTGRKIPGKNIKIDHILVTPARVYVVTVRNAEGIIETVSEDEVNRKAAKLHVGGVDRTELAAAARWIQEHVRTSLAISGVDDVPVTGVLAFPSPIYKTPTMQNMIDGVYLPVQGWGNVLPRRAARNDAKISEIVGVLDRMYPEQIHLPDLDTMEHPALGGYHKANGGHSVTGKLKGIFGKN